MSGTNSWTNEHLFIISVCLGCVQREEPLTSFLRIRGTAEDRAWDRKCRRGLAAQGRGKASRWRSTLGAEWCRHTATSSSAVWVSPSSSGRGPDEANAFKKTGPGIPCETPGPARVIESESRLVAVPSRSSGAGIWIWILAATPRGLGIPVNCFCFANDAEAPAGSRPAEKKPGRTPCDVRPGRAFSVVSGTSP